ncbi:hypothetical protein [Streptomyces sp. NPDC046862]|uniref:hypothetical protein n=1 Tax=Streptomyces sp. NPDC046862 TaxID=3154603 RepID=UPI0034562D66
MDGGGPTTAAPSGSVTERSHADGRDGLGSGINTALVADDGQHDADQEDRDRRQVALGEGSKSVDGEGSKSIDGVFAAGAAGAQLVGGREVGPHRPSGDGHAPGRVDQDQDPGQDQVDGVDKEAPG